MSLFVLGVFSKRFICINSFSLCNNYEVSHVVIKMLGQTVVTWWFQHSSFKDSRACTPKPSLRMSNDIQEYTIFVHLLINQPSAFQNKKCSWCSVDCKWKCVWLLVITASKSSQTMSSVIQNYHFTRSRTQVHIITSGYIFFCAVQLSSPWLTMIQTPYFLGYPQK